MIALSRRLVRLRPVDQPSHSAGARRILLNSGFRLFADVGSKLASLVLVIVMARELGAAPLGAFTLALSLGALLATFGRLGQQSVLTRAVARDRAQVHDYFSNTVALQLVFALPAVGLAIVFAPLFGLDSELRLLVGVMALAAFLEAVVATCFSVYQAYERLGFIPVVLIAQRWLTAGAGTIAILLGADVELIGVLYLGGVLVAIALAWRLLRRHVVSVRWSVDPRRWLPLLRAALPIGLAGVFNTVLFRINIAMLAGYASTTVVGYYGAVYRAFESSLFLSWSIAAAVYPVFARLGSHTEPTVQLVFDRSLKMAAAFSFPVAAGAMVLAEPVVTLIYGEGFAPAAGALVLLGPAFALYPIGYLGSQLLVARDRQRVLAPTYAVIAVVNIGLNLVLIPALSLEGAALSTSISQLLVAVALGAFAVRTAGGIDPARILTGPVIATLVASGAMVLLRDHVLVAVGVATLAYLITLYLVERRAYPDDVAVLSDVVRPRRASGDLASL
jgi:O-antigen/teichoic acid export membrane protein